MNKSMNLYISIGWTWSIKLLAPISSKTCCNTYKDNTNLLFSKRHKYSSILRQIYKVYLSVLFSRNCSIKLANSFVPALVSFQDKSNKIDKASPPAHDKMQIRKKGTAKLSQWRKKRAKHRHVEEGWRSRDGWNQSFLPATCLSYSRVSQWWRNKWIRTLA